MCARKEADRGTNIITQGHDAPGHYSGVEAGDEALHAGLLCCVGEDNFIHHEAANNDVDTPELSCDVILGAGVVNWRYVDTPLLQLKHIWFFKRSGPNQGRNVLCAKRRLDADARGFKSRGEEWNSQTSL